MNQTDTLDPAPSNEGSARPLFQAVFLIALGMLLFEIALTRVLSFTIWYHFAYVVLSLAMLGFGAAGSWIAVRPNLFVADPSKTIARSALGAAVATVVMLLCSGLIGLDPIELSQKPGELAILVFYVVVGTIPFLMTGIAISVALRVSSTRVHSLYAWDLLGGGAGCALAVPVMNWLSPPGAVLVAAAAFALAALRMSAVRRFRGIGAAVTVACLTGAPIAETLPFPVAQSKHLAMMDYRWLLDRVEFEWTALFRTDIVQRTERSRFERNDEWGLSPIASWPIQQPWGFMLHDGTAGAPIYDLREGDLDFLDDHVLRLPYTIAKPNPLVLVIGVGGGRDLIVADRYGASHVTGVELDPATVKLVRDQYRHLHGGLFDSERVHLVAGEGRHFLESSTERWDLIQMTGVDTLAATATGAYVLAENYLYTVEAIDAFLDHLTPGGLVSIATGLWNPQQPRSAARMMNVARAALEERGVAEPERHIAVIHSKLLVAEVLIKNEPFNEAELALLKAETKRLGFLPLVLGDDGDPLWKTLLGDGPERERTLRALPNLVEAVRDDKPFFFHFFRWSDLVGSADTGPTHNTALGQMVLGLLALVLTVATLLVIVLPLFGKRGVLTRARGVLPILGYFLAIGFGFMFFEISLMQRLVRYLGYPTYAISVVLFTLLTFLGLGSLASERWVGRERGATGTAFGMLVLLTGVYMVGLPWIEDASLGAPLLLRIAICVVLLAPLGLILGLFLPLGIRRAAAIHVDVVPWAWAANAGASVVATVVSVILAMEVGFSGVWLISLGLYAGAVLCMLRMTFAGSRAA